MKRPPLQVPTAVREGWGIGLERVRCAQMPYELADDLALAEEAVRAAAGAAAAERAAGEVAYKASAGDPVVSRRPRRRARDRRRCCARAGPTTACSARRAPTSPGRRGAG